MNAKVAVILQAGTETHEGLARALHALLYTRELRERGGDARIVFDGAGTGWLARFRNPDDDSTKRLAALFQGLKDDGLVYEVCDFCSGAFQVREQLTDEPMSGKYMDHPSIADLVDEGYHIWIL
jgi:hypothetical protein